MKNFVAFIRSMLSKRAFVNVFAEENLETKTDNTNTDGGDQNKEQKDEKPGEEKPTPKPSGSINYEDLISEARKQEKDKLYPQIEKLKSEKNDLLIVIGERDAKINELTKEVEKLKESNGKLSKDLESGTKTNKTVSELTTKISILERQLDETKQAHESELTKIRLEQFKEKQIASAEGKLIPELVSGSTEEEIQASIELAKQRYEEITQSVIQSVQMPYTNPNAQVTQLSMGNIDKDISQMSDSEWAEYRRTLGIK